jgi:hypothetical protein
VLIERAAKLLEIDVAIVREALERLLLDGELVYEPIGGHDLIYLPYLRRAEDGIASLLWKRCAQRCPCVGPTAIWRHLPFLPKGTVLAYRENLQATVGIPTDDVRFDADVSGAAEVVR